MKYVQLYAVDKNDKSMHQNWMKHLKGEQGFKILQTSTPYNWITGFKNYGAESHMGWAFALPEIELDNGEVVDVRDDWLVHIHLTGENINLIERLRRLDKKITIIASCDYSLDIWEKCLGFHQLEGPLNSIDKADYVFNQEPTLSKVFSEYLNRDVPCIPHPCDVETTAKFISDYTNPKTCIVNTHYYAFDYYQGHFVTYNIPNLRTNLIGLSNNTYNQYHGATAGILYNKITPYIDFELMVDPKYTNSIKNLEGGFLPKAYCSFDAYSLRVTGRWQATTASLGIPTIGSNLQFFQKLLFPDLTSDYYNVASHRNNLKKLMEDKDFHNEVSKESLKRVCNFNIESTMENMMSFLNGRPFTDYKDN